MARSRNQRKLKRKLKQETALIQAQNMERMVDVKDALEAMEDAQEILNGIANQCEDGGMFFGMIADRMYEDSKLLAQYRNDVKQENNKITKTLKSL